MRIVADRVDDHRTVDLIRRVVESFQSTGPGKGLPLGNLTSQLLVNVYMNEFDQYIKHGIRAKYYIRYADDFVVLSEDRAYLESILPQMQKFLEDGLHISMHPKKIHLITYASGVDFLGWAHFPDHRVLRTSTKRRMVRNVQNGSEAQRESYKGLLTHGNAQKLHRIIFLQK